MAQFVYFSLIQLLDLPGSRPVPGRIVRKVPLIGVSQNLPRAADLFWLVDVDIHLPKEKLILDLIWIPICMSSSNSDFILENPLTDLQKWWYNANPESSRTLGLINTFKGLHLLIRVGWWFWSINLKSRSRTWSGLHYLSIRFDPDHAQNYPDTHPIRIHTIGTW